MIEAGKRRRGRITERVEISDRRRRAPGQCGADDG